MHAYIHIRSHARAFAQLTKLKADELEDFGDVPESQQSAAKRKREDREVCLVRVCVCVCVCLCAVRLCALFVRIIFAPICKCVCDFVDFIFACTWQM